MTEGSKYIEIVLNTSSNYSASLVFRSIFRWFLGGLDDDFVSKISLI